MRKVDTVALYREAFLEGKDNEAREKFDAKDLDRQYIAIMNWKRRQKALAEVNDANSAASLIASLKGIKKSIATLPEISSKEADKIISTLNAIGDDVKNFEAIRKSRRLAELKSQRFSLEREIRMLEDEGVKEC